MTTTGPQPSEGKLSFPQISTLHNLWIERINKVMNIFCSLGSVSGSIPAHGDLFPNLLSAYLKK
jgi:hypothetical protein